MQASVTNSDFISPLLKNTVPIPSMCLESRSPETVSPSKRKGSQVTAWSRRGSGPWDPNEFHTTATLSYFSTPFHPRSWDAWSCQFLDMLGVCDIKGFVLCFPHCQLKIIFLKCLKSVTIHPSTCFPASKTLLLLSPLLLALWVTIVLARFQERTQADVVFVCVQSAILAWNPSFSFVCFLE